ncbi:conserved protein of unknown function [Ruminococcaceae bacterium BL-6]|nr:conserved protein of unknown function [Ruminococcaceae bacterium BL-6]
MEYSTFFNSVTGSDGKPDRTYKAEDWDRHLKDLISNGIFAGGTNLQVTADGSGMSVVLDIGAAWINGKHYLNDQAITFPIDAADGTLNRADRIVIRLDTAGRYIRAQYKKGTFASTAVPPDLQRDADGWELCLADVSIPAGTTAITQALITDTRLDNDVCGIVTGLIDQVDTSTFYDQIASDLQHFRSTNEADFTAWVNGLKDILDDETAGNLLNLITSHTSDATVHLQAGEREKINGAVQKIPRDTLTADDYNNPSYPISYETATNSPSIAVAIGLPSGIYHIKYQSYLASGYGAQMAIELGSNYGTNLYIRNSNRLTWSAWRKVSDGGLSANTTSIASALTLSTAAPTSTLAAGKLWGVYDA